MKTKIFPEENFKYLLLLMVPRGKSNTKSVYPSTGDGGWGMRREGWGGVVWGHSMQWTNGTLL